MSTSMLFTSYYDEQNATPIKKDATPDNDNNHRQLMSSTTTKPKKQLPEKAVRLMNTWYLAHEDNPYPNRSDLEYLATHGGIREAQVKAWFSNKRNRTQNTHSKRAKRYLICNGTESAWNLWNESDKIHLGDGFRHRAFLRQHQQQYSLPSCYLSVMSLPNWVWIPTNSFDSSSYYYLQ